MIQFIIEFLKMLFGRNTAASLVPTASKATGLNETLADNFIAECIKYVGKTENKGKNRADWIDADNKRSGAGNGAPYCLTSSLCRLDDVCKQMKLKNPVGVHAGTQSFWKMVPSKWKLTVGKKGSIAIFRARADKSRGHAAPVRADQKYGDDTFLTVEFNTDGEGSRDGDGCWLKSRSVQGDSRLEWLGFVDVCGWVMSANQDVKPIETKPTVDVKPVALDLPWTGKHADASEWSAHIYATVMQSKLPDTVPSDVVAFCPSYKTAGREGRAAFWCHAISKMAQYESSFKPGTSYTEGFKDSKGDAVISRGLLQISYESGKSYYKPLKSPEELHDAKINLNVGVAILERWVVRDGVFSQGTGKQSRGGARYWSVLRESSTKRQRILDHLSALKLV